MQTFYVIIIVIVLMYVLVEFTYRRKGDPNNKFLDTDKAESRSAFYSGMQGKKGL